MVGVREGVLGVELEVVDARDRAQIHETRERLAGRHTIPAHIEHVPSDREVGPIADLDAGESVRILVDELVEGRASVAEAALVAVGEENAVRPDVEPVSLGCERRIVLDAHVEGTWRGSATLFDDLPRTREQHLGSVVLCVTASLRPLRRKT